MLDLFTDRTNQSSLPFAADAVLGGGCGDRHLSWRGNSAILARDRCLPSNRHACLLSFFTAKQYLDGLSDPIQREPDQKFFHIHSNRNRGCASRTCSDYRICSICPDRQLGQPGGVIDPIGRGTATANPAFLP